VGRRVGFDLRRQVRWWAATPLSMMKYTCGAPIAIPAQHVGQQGVGWLKKSVREMYRVLERNLKSLYDGLHV
jgi:hypothetical protein